MWHGLVYSFVNCQEMPARVCAEVRGPVTAGAAVQAKDNTLVHVNGSGAAVGLSEALCDVPRLGTVTADTHVEAFSLGAKVFKAIMESNPEARPPPAHVIAMRSRCLSLSTVTCLRAEPTPCVRMSAVVSPAVAEAAQAYTPADGPPACVCSSG